MGCGRDLGAAPRGSDGWESRGTRRLHGTGNAVAPAAPESATRQPPSFLQPSPRTPVAGHVTGRQTVASGATCFDFMIQSFHRFLVFVSINTQEQGKVILCRRVFL